MLWSDFIYYLTQLLKRLVAIDYNGPHMMEYLNSRCCIVTLKLKTNIHFLLVLHQRKILQKQVRRRSF